MTKARKTAILISVCVNTCYLAIAVKSAVKQYATREMLKNFECASGLTIPKSSVQLHSEWTFFQSNHLRTVLYVRSETEFRAFTNSLFAINKRMREQSGMEEFEYVTEMNKEALLGDRGLFSISRNSPSESCAICAQLGYGDVTKSDRWATAAERNLIWIWFTKR